MNRLKLAGRSLRHFTFARLTGTVLDSAPGVVLLKTDTLKFSDEIYENFRLVGHRGEASNFQLEEIHHVNYFSKAPPPPEGFRITVTGYAHAVRFYDRKIVEQCYGTDEDIKVEHSMKRHEINAQQMVPALPGARDENHVLINKLLHSVYFNKDSEMASSGLAKVSSRKMGTQVFFTDYISKKNSDDFPYSKEAYSQYFDTTKNLTKFVRDVYGRDRIKVQTITNQPTASNMEQARLRFIATGAIAQLRVKPDYDDFYDPIHQNRIFGFSFHTFDRSKKLEFAEDHEILASNFLYRKKAFKFPSLDPVLREDFNRKLMKEEIKGQMRGKLTANDVHEDSLDFDNLDNDLKKRLEDYGINYENI